MNEKYQEFYDYLKSQNLTDLDAESFQIAYSEPEKFNELWGYISEQNLTDLTRDEFFDSYFSDVKKKDTASVSEPGSLVSPELEVPVETAIAPATEAAEPATTLTGAADPDFFEERMEMISPQLIDRGDEDEVAQELTDVFKPYGFEVEPAGIGDAIKVTAGNGKSIEVDLDPFEMPKILSPFGLDFNTETETAEAKKLQDFLRENRQEGLDAPRRFVTNKQRDDEVKRINQKQKEINRSAQDYLKRKLEFQNKYPQFLTYDPEYIKNNPEEYQRFLNDRDSLEKEREFVVEIDQRAKEEGAQLDRLAGEYTEMLAQRGYWSGGVFRNEFIQGIAEIAAGAKDFGLDTGYDPKFLMETDPEFFKDNYLKEAADKGYDVPSASDMTVDEFKAWMKTDKGIPAKESIAIQTSIVDTKLKRRKRGEPIDYEEALNAYSQYATSKNMEVTDGELAALRRGLDFLKDPESTPEAADLMYESFWGGALLGVTRSLPAILVPGGFITRTAAMYSQISSALEQEMAKDPDFRDISEAERFRLKLAIGSASSVLESLGVRNVLKKQGLLTGILMKALKKTPANVKGKAFNEVVMREINSAIGRGALVITGAGLAEFETGFLQEGVDIGFKSIYNEMKDKEMFETPEAGFWSSETFNRMLYAGAQEAVGGFVLGTPGAISAARGTYDFTAVDDATFEMFENVSSQTARGELTYRHMFYTNLQAKINQGKISKEDAQQEMDNLDEVIAVNRDIPSDLTVSQKKKALGILLRKKDLQEQIEGKDPILVKRQQEELNSLNGELDQILYGTPETDAIQEPSPETVDAPELTPSSEAVGEGVPDIGEPTTEVEAEDQVAEAPPTAEVAVEETVSEPTQEVTEEEQVDIDEFFGEQDIEGVEKVSENLVINRKQKAPTADPKSQRRMNRVRQMSVKAAASIRKIAPEVKILIHESPEEYQRFAGEQTAGNYDPKTKTIHINLGKANLYTAPHEVFHALLLQNISTDSEALTVSRKMLESVRKVVDPNSQMAKDIDEFVARYGDAPTIQDEEYLAQLTGILTAEYRTLNKPAKNAVKDFLRKLAKMLGLEKYLGPEFLKTDEQVIDLLNTISRRMSEGEYIEAADVQAMGDILSEATPAEQAQAQSEVEEFNRKQKEEKAAEEKAIMARKQIVGERASLEDDVRDGLDMAMLTYAEQGDSKKVRREVKAAWGWEKGADGKWRYEIETGELKKVPNGTYKLGDVYDAPELYKAYPEAKDISLMINVRDAGAENSWFIIDKNAVEINVKNYGRVRPDLIHELQHYIQLKEGFAIGGDTGTAIDLINSLSPDKLKEINILEGKESAMSMLSDIAEESELTYVDDLKSIDTIEDFLNRNTKDANLLNSLYGDDAASYVLEVLNEDLIDLEDGDLMGGIYQVLKTIQEQTENKDGRSMWSPYAVYQRLIGEVEARNAASRDGGGRSLIEDSEDTPREDQLAVFDEQEKVLRKIEAKEEMTEQELDALDLAKLPAQEGSNKGAGLFYGPRATIANYESAKTMFADGVPAEDIEMLTGWNVVEKQNGDVVYVLSRNEVESKDTIDKAIASRKDRGVSPRMQVEGINPKDVRMRSRSGNRVGKGLSVKKVNNEAVVEEIPDLTLDYVRENAPASYLKNANLIAQYPLVRGVKNFDDVSTLEQADEVYEVYARQVADNLNWIMESYPEEYREISTLWYDGANKIANELAADYGVSPEQVAGIIASLSPQNDWYQNVRAAELLLLAFRENPVMSQKMIDYQVNYAEGKINKLRERIKSAGKAKGKSQAKAKVAKFKAIKAKNLKAIADAEALLDLLRSYKGKRMEDAPDALKPYYVRLYSEVNQPKSYPIISPDGNYGSDALTDAGGKRKFGWGSYTEIGKGVSIRLDGSQENTSVTLGQMHKIRNFFNNIIDPMSKEKDITMDTHAIAAALLIPASSKTKEVVQNFGTGTANSGVKGQKGLYYANQAGYFLSAEENNMLPRQVQSVTWEAVRGLFTSKFKDGAKNVKSINDIWENYAEGNITIEEARQEVLEKADGINAPSWAGLISDESRDGDGTTTERGRGKRGGPATEREGVAPRQQVVYHVTVRDNKGNIQKKGLEKDRPPTFAKGVMGTEVFDTAGKSFAFSNLEDATKWGIKTKIEKDKEVSIVAINAEGKTLQEDKAVTEDPFNPLSSAVFTEDVISPSDILSVEDVDYKMGKPFDKSGEPLTEESFDIEEGVAPRQQKPYPSGPQEATEMGYLVHASDKSRDSFDKKFIKGRNRTELGALGFYFTSNAQKAMDYGGEYTYIDPSDMNLLNLDEVKGNKLQSFLSDLERNLGKLSSYRMRLIAAQDEVRSNREFNEFDAELKKVDAQIKAQSPFGTSAFSQDKVLQALKEAKAKSLMEAYKVAEYAIERDGRKSNADAAFSDLLFNAGYDGIYEGPGLYKVAIFDIDGLNNAIVKPGVAPRQQLSDIATPLPRQQKSVREVVQQARDNNFKDAATKDFLTRKGVPTADIDKAIKTLDEVYARVMKEIDGVITKSQKRGVEIDTQLKNALAYLQGTKLYEDTTDIHREKLMREVRAKFDKKEKRAPSAKRILGKIKDVKKVTLSEKEALKMQLRLVAKTAKTTARALVVASNELTKSLKEMVKGGVITANQMSSVLRRFSRVDLFNPASIDSFLDYMGKIFADAEYGAKIARIKKLLPRAKKNIKSKIGVADVLGDTLTKLFNVNPTLIPMEMLEDYQNLLEMMGAAKKVLPLADINDVTEVANKLLNAVYEEVSMAEDLAEVFANYENKVIKDGKVDYAATIEAMIADQTISLEEAAVMRKYKSRIVEPAKKEPKTEEELAEERAELMSAVEAAKVNVSRLVMDEERTLARQLAKLMRTEAIERLSNQQLETLLAVIDNINNGFVTHAAQRLAETMNASNRAESLLDSTLKAVPLPLSTFVGKIKSGITKNNKFFESIKRNPLVYIDQVFGDFQTTRIYDAVFKPLAQAYDTFSLEMKKVDKRLTDAQEAVMKSFKNDPNKARMSSYKMMAYMLQREFEANPDNKQVNPAADFIRATIEHINKGQSFFKGKDAEMLQQILDDFGGEQIDSQKLYDSFNKAERNALAVMEDINKSMGSKAVFTGAVIRGRRVDALNQYAHHNVLSTSGQMDRSADVSIIEAYNQSMRASTKAKNLIERTGAATPLNFDVFSSVSRGSRFTLTDFYLTEPIRTSRKAISDTRKILEERGDITKQENEIVNAVENALELTLDDLLTRTFSQSTMLENVIQYVKKTGYRLVLASGTRAMAEGASNLAFVSIYAPKDFAAGMANKKMVMGTVGIDVMSNLKSTQLSRMYPNEVLSGRMIDTSVLGEKAGDKGGRAYGDVRNKITQIYNGLLAPAKKGVELVADTLISAPDKAVIRPLWFGSFENAFVEITGKKPEFEKIAANDEAYMAANQEALNKATDTADQVTTLAGAADNPFKSMLRGKYPSKAKQTALLQFFNNFNSFMTRFLIYEYISARTAVNAMLGNGMISKRQGAALLGAVTTRMVVYTLAGTVLNQLLKQAFGLDEEEDEKDIMKQFGQSLASTATSLIVGRDFGNVVKGLLNYGVENLNEEFLDDLREGDYDPYRDSIAYTFIPPDKEYKSNTLADYIRNLMGPFGPFYKMAEFGVKTLSADEKKDPAARIRQQRELNERLPLELLGNLGLIPLYRDIRALLLADIYKGMGKDKKGSGTGMTKAEKAQMKEYFPELYKMQMQMEEDMKNPELEKFEKEMKLLEKQLEESLKQR